MRELRDTATPQRGEFIYWVHFDLPTPYAIDGDGYLTRDFFFHSLAAIYDRFTPPEIGCAVDRLYAVGVGRGVPYHNARRSVTIRRTIIYRKKHRLPQKR